MRTPSDQAAADARRILEAISDFRSDGDYEKADQAIASVMNLPTSALHTIIDVAAALAVTVRDICGPHAPETARETAGDR